MALGGMGTSGGLKLVFGVCGLVPNQMGGVVHPKSKDLSLSLGQVIIFWHVLSPLHQGWAILTLHVELVLFSFLMMLRML